MYKTVPKENIDCKVLKNDEKETAKLSATCAQ